MAQIKNLSTKINGKNLMKVEIVVNYIYLLAFGFGK